ncbi:MAG: aldehyde dehydrogenase family protein [Candidatus Zixiibacteriota bacterium]|nr:MAG: aldehyde dehydrogenase family protein [candidate division Zixibacteria bacterium]
MSREYKNFIAGEWVDAASGERVENRNPADRDDLIGTFPKSGEAEVNAAVAAAREAYKKWRLVPAPIRGEILKKVGDIMTAHKEDIARVMTREMGKVLKETRGDTQEGIDTAYYAASETRRLFSHTTPSELPNKMNISFRMPIGVAGIITPWNFPMAIPTWKIFPALACGNTVVFKPASDTPATATTLVEILAEAGVPEGVVNIVHGSGSKVGTPLVAHPGVNVISFTGSSEAGKQIYSLAGSKLKRVSLELGGKNAVIVMPDADLDLALEGVLWGAFGTTGQRCTATSRLILHEAVHDKFVAMLVERANRLKVGNGLDESVEMGPCVNQGQLNVVEEYVQIGKGEGAQLVAGGSRLTGGAYDKGTFHQATIFTGVKPGMRLEQEEIFGPVLSVIKVQSFDEAVTVLNDTAYGLSSSIYTRDVNLAFKAVRDIECGITYVNGPTIGAEAHMPFGGMKETGNGHREGGWQVYEFFSETKTVYVDFSGKLQKAQIDTEQV